MRNFMCDVRLLLLIAAAAFIYIQALILIRFKLFRCVCFQHNLSMLIVFLLLLNRNSEDHYTTQMRLLIDQISMQQGQILDLQQQKTRLSEECQHVKSLVYDLQTKSLHALTHNRQEMPVAAVVVMACNRADYLQRTIDSILKYQIPVASKYPLFVSQDGSHPGVKRKALSYDQLTYMQHLDYQPVRTERPGEIIAYYKIASHYKWALDELFYKHNFTRVIILEDDMEIAPDFFDYFEAAAALLEKDKSIMAVSSWNDNGQKQFVHDPYALYRSDFFPGLGWMLSRSTWDELSPKWPKAYWDDWLRLKENHKGRQFIRPEVCRTYNFGEHGSSMGQFYKQYLEPIKLNDKKIDWKSIDLSYLLEDKYVKYFGELVKKASPVGGHDAVLKAYNIDGDVRIKYSDQEDFERITRKFGIFEEWKDGIPRAAYKGVVVFRHQTERRIFLVGPDSLKQLGIEDIPNLKYWGVALMEILWKVRNDTIFKPTAVPLVAKTARDIELLAEELGIRRKNPKARRAPGE